MYKPCYLDAQASAQQAGVALRSPASLTIAISCTAPHDVIGGAAMALACTVELALSEPHGSADFHPTGNDGGNPAQGRVASAIVWGAAGLGALVVLGAAALWFHYGTAVFFEMIAAGISACF